MSFRSMLLLRRSTELEEVARVGDGDLTVDQVEGAIVVVEADTPEMQHWTAILNSLNCQVFTATDDFTAQRMILELVPVMVLSSRKLQPLEGYSLHPHLPESTPFVYLQDSVQVSAPKDSHAEEARPLKAVETAVQSSHEETRQANGVEEEEAEEKLATAEDILRGLRGPEGSEEDTASSDKENQIEPTGEENDEDEEPLTPVQQFRAEFQAHKEAPDSVPDLDKGDPSETAVDLRTTNFDSEDSVVSEPSEGLDPTGLVPPDPEDEYSIIGKIDAQEIASLSNANVLFEDSPQTDPLPPLDLYQEARSYVLESIRIVEQGRLPDLIKGEFVSERIVSSLEVGSALLLEATDRTQEFSVSAHSVNTGVFAVRIAEALNLSRWQRLRIALAALLHEIGVVSLPRQLIYKTEKPTLEEIKILRQRPIYASRCLKGVERRYDWLSEVVGQVYERENGTGHPLGLTGREICEEAKVIGISDLFDACIHRRPYRDALTGYQALFELTTDQARTFSDRIVKALIKSLSLFPYNEFVVLSSGEIGKVAEINLENLSRPVVEVIYDKEGVAVEAEQVIDLAENPSLYISKALPYKSLPSK